MHRQHLLSVLGLYAASIALAQAPQSLLSTLEDNGFTEFAQRLEASDIVSTIPGIIVYAPNNNAFIGNDNVTVARRISNTARAAYNLAQLTGGSPYSNETGISVKRLGKRTTSRGSVYETLYQDSSVHLSSGHNQTLIERNVPSASLPFVFSGLGKTAKVIGSDIPYKNGVIRPIDAILTLPKSLSSTLRASGDVKLAAALKQADLIGALESTASITVLAPSNEVFSLSSTLTQNQLVQVLKEHIIVSSSSLPVYSPWLEDGQTFRTLGGTNVSVVIKDDVAYLNGARLLEGDSLIENGVVHTIDKMLSGNIPTVPVSGAMMTRSLPWETLFLSFIGTAVAAGHLLG